jgi:hypothetical protein
MYGSTGSFFTPAIPCISITLNSYTFNLMLTLYLTSGFLLLFTYTITSPAAIAQGNLPSVVQQFVHVQKILLYPFSCTVYAQAFAGCGATARQFPVSGSKTPQTIRLPELIY